MADDDVAMSGWVDRYFEAHPQHFPIVVAGLGWVVGVMFYGIVIGVTVAVGDLSVTWYIVASVLLAGCLPGWIGYRYARVAQAALQD